MTDETIFAAALEQPTPAERAAYLDSVCAADAEQRRRIAALLAAHEKAVGFLEHPPVTLPDSAAAHTREFDPGKTSEVAPHDELGFLQPGTRPDSLGRIGHYEVLELLGKGGFGIVFRAFDEVLQRVVAVKVLSPQMAATSPARKRFLREARSSGQIRHENVVQVHAVEETPLPYLVMEFIPGETLQQRLDRTGPLDIAEILGIGRQIAEGLAAAHANGLIHRDVKPANVLIETSGSPRVKLTDFGLARAADDASISQSGVVAGTPMYMAPEQARGETLDHRADLFSLGSVLYAILSGRPPFRAETTLAVLKRVCDDTPRPIREIIPEVPDWLCRIVQKLHAKNPEERFQTAREVADLLADCEAQLKAHGMLKDYSRIPGGGKPERKPQWRKRVAAALGVVLPVLAGVGLYLLFRTPRPDTPLNLPDQNFTDKERLQGRWRVVSAERDGKQVPGIELDVMNWIEFKGDKLTNNRNGTVTVGKFTLNAEADPRELDFATEGHPPNRAIYRFDGDRLIVAQSRPDQPNQPRPTSFVSTTDNGITTATYARYTPPSSLAVPKTAADILTFIQGTWKRDSVIVVPKLVPEKARSLGHVTFDPVAGGKVMRGLAVDESGHSSNLVLHSYDSGSGRIHSWVFLAEGETSASRVGIYDPADRNFYWVEPLPDGTQSSHHMKFVDSGTVTTRNYDTDATSEIVFELRATYTRTNELAPILKPFTDPKRPDEMAVLDRLVGEWRSNATVKDAAGVPKSETWRATARLLLGGRFVEVVGTNDAGGSDYAIIWFDPAAKKYRQWYFNEQGHEITMTGTWDAATSTLAWETADKSKTGRWVFKGNDARDYRHAVLDKDGKPIVEMTGEWRRVAASPPAVPKTATEVLSFLAGSWKLEGQTIVPRPAPDAAPTVGMMIFDRVAGGAFLRARSTGETGFDDVRLLYSFDADKNVLRQWQAWSNGSTYGPVTGLFNPDNRTLTWRQKPNPNLETFYTFEFVDSNTVRIRLYHEDASSTITREMRMTLTRMTGPATIPGLPIDPNRPVEMKALDRLVGEWREDLTVTSAAIPNKPKAETALVRAESILGGRFIEVLETNETKNTSDYWLTWFDPERKQYRTWYFGGDGSVGEPTMAWNEATKILTWGSPNSTIEGRYRFTSDDRREVTYWIRDTAGNELSETTGVARRVDGDRKMAEWAFKVGTRVLVECHSDGKSFVVQRAEDLPTVGRIYLVSVNIATDKSVDDAAVLSAFALLPPDTKLRTFLLTGASVTDTGLEKLTEIPTFKNLNGLLLRGSKLTVNGLVHLNRLPKLSSLALDGVTDEWVKEIVKLKNLSRLTVSYSPLTDGGLRDLAGLPLAYLDLRTCPKITEEGLKHLHGHPTLAAVNLQLNNQFTEAGVKRLWDSLPNRNGIAWKGGQFGLMVSPPDAAPEPPTIVPAPAVAPFDATKAKELQEAWAKHLGREVEIENSIGMKLRLIPPGTFTMGEPKNEKDLKSTSWPAHKVTVKAPFYIGVHEVTCKQYDAIVPPGVPRVKVTLDWPVTMVSWHDAKEFCRRLNEREEEKKAGRTYRLVSEVEWEYACRAGTTGPHFFGAVEKIEEYGWIADNGGPSPHPPGGKKPNPWGLYDMVGNVQEWCQDTFEAYKPDEREHDPTKFILGMGQLRIARSSSFRTAAGSAGSAERRGYLPTFALPDLGFRVVVLIEPKPNAPTVPGMGVVPEPRPVGATPSPAVAPFDEAKAKELQEAWAKKLGVDVEIENSIGMKLRLIPPGEFLMGSNDKDDNLYMVGPQHKVTVKGPFYVGVHEVTRGQYESVVKPAKPGAKDTFDLPIANMTWHEAKEFCKQLSERDEEKKAGRTYRLVSDVEFEYACRAGTTTPYYFGAMEKIDEFAWFADNSNGKAQPVGKKKPNAWGLHDMIGNVHELCHDSFEQYKAGDVEHDPLKPIFSVGGGRVVRSSNFKTSAKFARSTSRAMTDPTFKSDATGFRVVMLIEAKPKP